MLCSKISFISHYFHNTSKTGMIQQLNQEYTKEIQTWLLKRAVVLHQKTWNFLWRQFNKWGVVCITTTTKLSSTTCYAITYYLKTWFTFLKCCTWQIIENVRSPLTVFCQIFYHPNIWHVSFRSYLKHEHLMMKTKKKLY